MDFARANFHEQVRKNISLDGYSDEVNRVFKKYPLSEQEKREIDAVVRHSRRLLLLRFETRIFGNADVKRLAEAAKNHLAVFATTHKDTELSRNVYSSEQLDPELVVKTNSLLGEKFGAKIAEDDSVEHERHNAELFIKKVEAGELENPSVLDPLAGDLGAWFSTAQARQRQILRKRLLIHKIPSNDVETAIKEIAAAQKEGELKTNDNLILALKKSRGI